MPIIIVKIVRQVEGALVAILEAAAVGPLPGEGLSEAFGLAVGLRTIGTSEEVFEVQLGAGIREEF